jgi:hypothetical protein
MKTILIILVVLLAQGCRTYGIEKGTDEFGNPYVKVDVSSSADMKAPNVHYKRIGEDVTFDFSAEEIDNNTQDFMGMFQGMMGMMMEMMKAQMLMNAAPPAVNE